MPKDDYSGLRRAYAAAAGVTLRTAQRHQKTSHPDWARFIGATAAEGVKRATKEGTALEKGEAKALAEVSPSRPEELPAFYDVPDSELSPAQLHEKRAWRLHDATFQAWERMLETPGVDPLMTSGLARQCAVLREDHEKARGIRERWELEQRRLIPWHEFEAFVGQFLVPLAELLRNMAVELPVRMNPDNPAYAREMLLEFQRGKVQPQIEAMLEGAREFSPAA